jgi:hypothetical protein
MNKLKKTQRASPSISAQTPNKDGTMSRTMKLATTEAPGWTSVVTNLKANNEQVQKKTLAVRGSMFPTPTASSEQYWAARALTAEALLAAQEGHYHELRGVTSAEDAKRLVGL